MIIEVRYCDECDLEYENHFMLKYQEVVYYES